MLAKPLKSLGKKGKTLKIARNSLKRKKARKSKKARKRRLGFFGTKTKGLLMVVSKRWFEFSVGTKFRYPLFTSI